MYIHTYIHTYIHISEVYIENINQVIINFIKDKDILTYWEINCIHYAAAITVLEKLGKLKERWITNAETQINALGKKISCHVISEL